MAGAINAAVWRHLEHRSAHSDLVDVLRSAVKPLGDVQLFCPDWQACRYVVASTKGVIFGLAAGMDRPMSTRERSRFSFDLRSI